jgi:mono/diheme cytochrome c family protein
MIRRLILVTAVVVLPIAALAGDARRDRILADYAARARAADPGFVAFSAQRGETLFRSRWSGGDARTPSCTACHTADPRKPGQNAKTGRPIDPVAVSANPGRFTDAATVEKQFTRDCKSVLGRECTPLEKGDYITYLAGQ